MHITRRARARNRRIFSASAAALIACLVLAGWRFDIGLLKTAIPGLVAMNPISAVAFLFAALSIALFTDRELSEQIERRRLIAQICAGAATLIGAAKLIALASGPDVGVDRWLFSTKLALGVRMPNAMAPTTALNFALLGAALLLLNSTRRRSSLPWVCALIAGFQATAALLGYACGIQHFYELTPFVPMALHTAVAFLLVSFGTMSCQGNPVSLATPTGKNAGGTMARRLLPAAILVPAAIGWLRLEGQRTEIFHNEMGLALQTVANMVVFAFVVIWNARLLSRTDAERSKAELRLRRVHRDLESRVHERTEQLFTANQSLQLASGELEDRVRERTAILAETEARLHAIVENANSIILVKDLEGKIILVNQRFAALVGRPKEEILGRTDYDFFPKEMADEFRAHDVEAVRIGAVTEREETVPRSDGGCHTFIANKFPLRDSNGNIYALCDISTDITERKHMEDTLLENQRALEASVYANQLIMDNSRDVICTVDEAGRFVTVSAACETLWGYTTKELQGKRYIEMVLAEDREKTNRVAAEIVAGTAASDFENRYARKDGSVIHMMWSAYWSDADRIMFAVGHDITERARHAAALNQAKEDADRANRAKSEFLSRMSHELRTPMNAILGFAQLLEMDALTSDQSEGVKHILRGGHHLLELINEILDLSRIEAGRMSLSLEPVPLEPVLRETLELVYPLAAERGVRLSSLPHCDAFILVDRQRLKQVLLNLLSNAIKYNRLNGSVTIRCEEEDQHIRILISDTGVGIPADRLTDLFTPFARLGAERDTVEGTGLGLAVTKRFVEAMKGTITVESERGE
ncbi:MAG TPA: PAS domain S-box protein, partial [Chthoniobacterales bacterium]|nr:PAS domain S-box protein [Chthoniobacterales bacterium]